MTLKFYTGLATADHRHRMLEDILISTQVNPNDRIFYLVPNHIKFDAEVDVLTRYGHLKNPDKTNLIAETQLQVFSIKRLIWYMMNNSATYQQPRVSKAGLFMLVRRAFQQADGLQIFQRMSQQAGFIEQLANQISELRLSAMTATDLKNLAIDATGELKQKLSDLSIILSLVEEQLVGKIITDTDMLNEFTTWLSEQNLSGMHFYFEGFSQFTIPERRILEMLITKTNVSLALVTDEKVIGNNKLKSDGFFGRTNTLINELQQFAKAHRVDVESVTVTDNKASITPGMRVFERAWLRANGVQQTPLTAIDKKLGQTAVEVYVAETAQAEVEQVARYIRKQVSQSHGAYRYRDFLIVARDLAQYQTLLAPIFKRYDIPIFTDLDFAMTDHPLVELLRTILEIADPKNRNYYQYYTLMRLLKTQLLRPKELSADDFRIALDSLENYLLAFNPRQKDWESTDQWIYMRSTGSEEDWQLISVDDQVNEKINLIRYFVVEALQKLRLVIKTATTTTMAVTSLYNWLVEYGVVDVLNEWREYAVNNGDLVAASQPEEAWKMLLATFDEMVNLIGEETYNYADFSDTILAGFSGAKFAGIPAAIDKVQISEMGIVQNDNYRVVMMLGGTKLNLPAHIKNHSLLSDRNRDDVKALSQDFYLRDTSREQMAEEPLLAYLSWSRASERLVLSYPQRSKEGVSQQISPYLIRLLASLGVDTQAPLPMWHNMPSLTDSRATTAQFIGTKRSTINHLAAIKRLAAKQHTELPAIWQQLETYLKGAEPLTQQILKSLAYRNVSEPIQPQLITALFNNNIQVSISKLETYNQNPYEYFLRHGLKLQERPVFELTAADSGQIFHKILEETINTLLKQNQGLNTMSLAEAQAIVEQQAQVVFEMPAFRILKSSSQMAFMERQLLKIVKQTISHIHRAHQKNTSAALATEISFGRAFENAQTWQGLRYELSNGKTMQINGKIDRVDTDIIGSNVFVNVIDYKSGNKKFDYKLAYNGLALQLLTYLLAVQANTNKLATVKTNPDQQIQLGGALYAHINNPKQKLKDIGLFPDAVLSPAGLDLLDEQLAETFSYQGLLVRDKEFLQSLQADLEMPGKAKYYEFSFTKNDIGKSGNVINASDLISLMAYNEYMLKQTGEHILSGHFPLAPVRYSDSNSALTYSPYKAIMNFDVAGEPGIANEYHDLENIKSDEVLQVSQLTRFMQLVAKTNQLPVNEQVTAIESQLGLTHDAILDDFKVFEHDTVSQALKRLPTIEKLDLRTAASYLVEQQIDLGAQLVAKAKAEKAAQKTAQAYQKEQDTKLKALVKVVKKYNKVPLDEALATLTAMPDFDLATAIPEIKILQGKDARTVINQVREVQATKLDEIIAELNTKYQEGNNG